MTLVHFIRNGCSAADIRPDGLRMKALGLQLRIKGLGFSLVSDGLMNASVSVLELRISVLVSVSDSTPRAHPQIVSMKIQRTGACPRRTHSPVTNGEENQWATG